MLDETYVTDSNSRGVDSKLQNAVEKNEGSLSHHFEVPLALLQYVCFCHNFI